MTTMEFLNGVISANISEDMTNYAKRLMDRDVHRAEQARKSSAARREKKDAPVFAAVRACLSVTTNTPWTSQGIVNSVKAIAGDNEVLAKMTTQKISAIMRKMVADGEVVEGVTSNPFGKGYVKSYALAAQTAEVVNA